MNAFIMFYQSSVGKKVLMAVSGALMIGFVIAHMAGNLKIFAGFDNAGIQAIDHYALYLRQIGQDILGYENFLWLARGGLLLALFVHVNCAISLYKQNLSARSDNYLKRKYRSSTVASLSMAIGGMVLFIFIIFHILHFTTGTVHTHGFKYGHVYQNLYNAFQHSWIVLLYSVAMISLGLHLYHGSWSMFQTLGIESRGWNKGLKIIAKTIALVVVLGFLAVPWSFYFGLVPQPTGVSVSYNEGN